MKWGVWEKKLLAWAGKYKLVLAVLGVGLLLLLWPGERTPDSPAQNSPAAEPAFDLNALERKLERVLSRVEGAGEVSVLLTVKGDVERVYAEDGTYSEDGGGWAEQTQTVVISTGSGTEEVVLVQQRYPPFQGAVVVCPGGADPQVRLLLTQAVSALTGLGADRVSVCKSQ